MIKSRKKLRYETIFMAFEAVLDVLVDRGFVLVDHEGCEEDSAALMLAIIDFMEKTDRAREAHHAQIAGLAKAARVE
jgi:acetolactate synthase regulatory subunit